jgi:hypothetical protein
MSPKKIRTLQKGVNETLKNANIGWNRIEVDGDLGPTTLKAARLAGSWQGLSKEQLKKIGNKNIDDFLWEILSHKRPITSEMKKRHDDRIENFQNMRKNHNDPPEDADGVSDWRGIRVAAWMVGQRIGPDGSKTNWLQKSVDKGWDGVLNSGWRSPSYSKSLCIAMCGAPSCPGTCAGESSNHSQIGPPNWGAIDVASYSKFGQIQKEIGSPLRNSLGPADPVHYSYTGR